MIEGTKEMARAARRTFTCYHEAGHAVARWFLGFHTDWARVLTRNEILAGVTIEDRNGEAHRCEGMVSGHNIDFMFLPPETEQRLVRGRVRAGMDVMVSMAGPSAEARYKKIRSLICLLEGGDDDLGVARQIADQWSLGESLGWLDKAWKQASALVGSQAGASAIQTLARDLSRLGLIDGEHIDGVCELAFGYPFVFDRYAAMWPLSPSEIRSRAGQAAR